MNNTVFRLLVAALASIVPLSGASNAEGEAYLKKNAEDLDVVVIPSGLQYKILESGPEDGISPGRYRTRAHAIIVAAPSTGRSSTRASSGTTHRLSRRKGL
jgi:hypothetical protein